MFEPLLSPSVHQLRVRPVCPRCGLVDKTARTVQVRQDNGLTLEFRCGYHGSQAVRLDDPAAVIDANTPIRTVLRSLCFSWDRDQQGIETVVLNGGDWAGAWMQRVYFDGLHQLARDSGSGVNDLPGWNRPVIRVACGGVVAVNSREHADGGTSYARCRPGRGRHGGPRWGHADIGMHGLVAFEGLNGSADGDCAAG